MHVGVGVIVLNECVRRYRTGVVIFLQYRFCLQWWCGHGVDDGALVCLKMFCKSAGDTT